MFDKVWEDAISLNSQAEPDFETLPAVSDLPERVSWGIDPSTFRLEHPLDHYIALDRFPIPIAEDREGYYGDRHFEYWLSGLQTAQETINLAKAHDISHNVYVELGSASGRVLRHFAYRPVFNELWAFDINWRHIAWIIRHLSKNITAIHNSSVPSLPLLDSSADMVSAMSVFTHIETFELQWLAEIRRILVPRGIALISLVTDHQIRSMTSEWPMYASVTGHATWSGTDDFIAKLRQQGKLVQRWRADSSYSSNVIYSEDYVRDVFSRLFEIVEYRHQYPDFQDFLVLRRRS